MCVCVCVCVCERESFHEIFLHACIPYFLIEKVYEARVNIISFVTSQISHISIAQLAGPVEYTDNISAEEKKNPTHFLFMTLNNLLVRFQ